MAVPLRVAAFFDVFAAPPIRTGVFLFEAGGPPMLAVVEPRLGESFASDGFALFGMTG